MCVLCVQLIIGGSIVLSFRLWRSWWFIEKLHGCVQGLTGLRHSIFISDLAFLSYLLLVKVADELLIGLGALFRSGFKPCSIELRSEIDETRSDCQQVLWREGSHVGGVCLFSPLIGWHKIMHGLTNKQTHMAGMGWWCNSPCVTVWLVNIQN